MLDPSDIVRDPTIGEISQNSTTPQRVCEKCFDETNGSIPARFQGSSSSLERIVVDADRLAIPTNLRRSQSSSQISDLAE